MMIVHHVLGLINALAYGLRRSKLGLVRLNVALAVLCLFLAGYNGWRGWQDGYTPAHVVSMALCLLLVSLLIWAEARHYLLFRPGQITVSARVPTLPPEKKLFLRGSGLFEVSNMRRRLVEVPVVFWATELAEYILAAKVHALNVLGLGVPAAEKGWWYIFLEPREVNSIVSGELYFGLQRRPAVRISYRTERGLEAIYLSSEDPQQVAIVVHDLQSKVQACQRRPGERGLSESPPPGASQSELPNEESRG